MADAVEPDSDDDAIEYLKDRFAGVVEMVSALDELEALSSAAMNLEWIDDIDNDEIDHFRDKILRLVELAEIGLGDIDSVFATPSLAALFGGPAEALRGAIASYWVVPGPSHPQIWPHLTGFTDSVRTLLASTGTAATTAMPQIHQQLTDTLAEATEQAMLLAAQRVNHDKWHDESVGSVSELVADADQQFLEIRHEAVTAAATMIDAANQRFEDDRKAFVEACTEHDSEADTLLDRIRQQLGIAGDITLSTGYAQRADTEHETADKLRNGALAFGIIAAAAALGSILWAAAIANDPDYGTWDLVPLKVVLIAALGSIAAYLGRQSERHRNFARRLRVNALELNNIGDYLSELTVAERSDVKRELVTTFFGQHLDPNDDDSPTTSQSADQLLDLLKLALKK